LFTPIVVYDIFTLIFHTSLLSSMKYRITVLTMACYMFGVTRSLLWISSVRHMSSGSNWCRSKLMLAHWSG